MTLLTIVPALPNRVRAHTYVEKAGVIVVIVSVGGLKPP